MSQSSQKRPRGRPSGSYSRNDGTYILRMAAALLHVPERSFRGTCETVFGSDPRRSGSVNAFVSRMHYRKDDIRAAMERIERRRRSTARVPQGSDLVAALLLVLDGRR